jgi:alkanesulfonate monooxygenase SsuD/methylene tetrahydromethanopterin reductase-like flavin-dependent oxidoreductase (luciferase family)
VNLAAVSIGLPGATDHGILRELAPQIEALGFRGLWLNDTPHGDSLAGLAVAAGVTTSLQLATGVIPLDRRPASEIAARLGDLPLARFTLGIGSGGPKGALARVAEGIEVLRPKTAVLVGALGPKMRKLGAERADGVLLNWLTPATAAEAMADLHRDAVGRPTRGVLYVRTIVDPEALPALKAEAAGYQSAGPYAANFARLGITALDATIDGTVDLAAKIARYTDVVDELVLRVVTERAALAAYQRFVEAVAGA